MSATRNPLVLVTRPAASAQAFVEDLRAVAGAFEALIVPAFAFEAIAADIPAFDVAIFTSQAGVEHAPRGEGRIAFCVGASTAQSAEAAGYAAVSAQGAAEDLIALILAKRPEGRLLHIRGEVAKGDVAVSLRAAGLECAEVVTYRKAVTPPNAIELERMSAADDVLLPLFSGETVSIIAAWEADFSAATVIAMSGDVADEARALSPKAVVVAERPDRAAMTQATAGLIA